ncbi:MAG: exo-alpha-sialidase [Planctomycetes bacterium]|nr:exo-alpha-sialidase [Planctomycetota bacterium]
MRPDRLRPVLAFTVSFCSAVLAQTGTVHTGTAPGSVRLSSGWTRSLTAQPDGRLWCLVRELDGSGTPAGSHLLLFASTDQGGTWTQITDVPTIGDNRGAIAAGRDCDRLHVAWTATDTGSYQNLYHQVFDTTTSTWIGTPELLLAGTNANDQYYCNDISVTAQGTIGIAFNTHRTPTLAGFTSWSGGIFVRRSADTSFQGPYRCNTDSYGMLANMQAIGEVFHLCFRTNAGLYGIRYRAFDAAQLQFTTAADLPLYGANQSNMRATNSSSIAADGDGNLYILYSVGSPNPAGGALEIAFASPTTGYSTWTTSLVEADPTLTAGNVTYQHYTLARTSGGVFAVFAKAGESFQNLYARILTPDPVTGGALVTPPASTSAIPLLLTTEADTFQLVDGLRAEAVLNDAMVVWSGVPSSQPAGQVTFLATGTTARTVDWGISCQGNLAEAPVLRGLNTPNAGSTFTLEIAAAPANAGTVLAAGLTCLLPPIDLTAQGFPGCTFYFAPVASSFLVTGSAGTATSTITVPSGLGNGFEIQYGALVLAPGANAGGAVFSNAVSVHFQ